MQLIGMLDSPYVRRVAVSLQLLGLPFEHRSISVFRGFDTFRQISPVVKAPSLVCDDGSVLLDSNLILEHAETLAAALPAARRRSLMPADPAARLRTLSLLGLALAACEKSVQIVYENLRPADKVHAPWFDRVSGQLRVAYGELEAALAQRPLAVDSDHIDQAGVSIAVAWRFTQALIPEVVDAAAHPRLAAHAAQAEALPVFRAAPHGEGSYPAATV
ncbi:glutathione S-transferase [Methylibium sp. Pch-M]|uniref:glutathione S-transferase family protein n=1 Tax=Methylibium sp. Pch-M TaxID=2082386 RepID=UPI001012F602|nr:glutathione S-transferase [Methylibium sp. Pch-M]QAZ39928.1 glutathione S-transferase [Methylibium sp. Pch-M]